MDTIGPAAAGGSDGAPGGGNGKGAQGQGRDAVRDRVQGAGSQEAEVIKELLAQVRHTSGIRFIALPVFLTATGALANAFMKGDELWMRGTDVVPWAGLLLSVVFAAFDILLSRNLIRLWEAVKALAVTGPWRRVHAVRAADDRRNLPLWAARIVLFLPYPLGAAFWADLLHEHGDWNGLADLPSRAWWPAPAGALALLLVAVLAWWRAHDAPPRP